MHHDGYTLTHPCAPDRQHGTVCLSRRGGRCGRWHRPALHPAVQEQPACSADDGCCRRANVLGDQHAPLRPSMLTVASLAGGRTGAGAVAAPPAPPARPAGAARQRGPRNVGLAPLMWSRHGWRQHHGSAAVEPSRAGARSHARLTSLVERPQLADRLEHARGFHGAPPGGHPACNTPPLCSALPAC